MRMMKDTVTAWRSEVDHAEVGGREVGTQGHVRVLQLPQDPPVELGANPVELHDVAGVLLDPETVELLHQITCRHKNLDSHCKPQRHPFLK